MPSSRPVPIPYVVDILRQIKPNAILDVGVGFGKYGHIFREYTDIVAAEKDSKRYAREHWQCRIEGIEVFESYLTPMHSYLYNEIHIGEASQVVASLSDQSYDLVWMGDVIEHLPKEEGFRLVRQLMRISRHCVVISTPSRFVEQSALMGNDHERHLSHWVAADFHSFGRVASSDLPDEVRLVVISHPDRLLPKISLRHSSIKMRLYRWWKRFRGTDRAKA
jgi:2-polyprenyl-3-methyl-5-hydroxy-6-metoxy-1,4-benzoquinol methylase